MSVRPLACERPENIAGFRASALSSLSIPPRSGTRSPIDKVDGVDIVDRVDRVDRVDKQLFPVRSAEPSASVSRLCCGLQAHSTVGACVCLGFSFAGSCAAAGSSGCGAAECPEWAPHTSLGLRLRRNPREAPTRNSTLKACHIANTKDDFHCQATYTAHASSCLPGLLIGFRRLSS